jgi:Flp pilus assembly protein TadB
MTPVPAVAVTPRQRPGRLLMASVTLALLYTIAKIGFRPAVALLFGLLIGAGAAWWYMKPRELQR